MKHFRSFVIAAPDTDQGKTTVASLFLHAAAQSGLFPRYWKPVQSGEPDTETVRRRCDGLEVVFGQAARSYEAAIAPHQAALEAGDPRLSIAELLGAAPPDLAHGDYVVETYGGPLSPLAEGLPQIGLLSALGLPVLIAAKNRTGAIHAVCSTVEILRARGLEVCGAVLVGETVAGNRAAIEAQAGISVVEVDWPASDEPEAFAQRAGGLSGLVDELVASPRPHAEGSQVGRPEGDAELRELDHRVTWHPYTPLVSDEERPIIRRAHGEWLELDTGERLVDGISSWWTCVHGHSHPSLRTALGEAAQSLDQVIFAGMAHEPGVRFADELLAQMPDEFERVFYSDSGSTANEVALKVLLGGWRRREAVAPEDRTLVLCLEGGYHGDTFGTMAVGRDPVFFAEFDPMLFEAVQIPMDRSALQGALDRYGKRLAGLILEPLVQGAGGMKMHAPEQVRGFCEIARQQGLPVVFDEVMTGFGRTGSMFAFERVGFVPDLVTLGKGLSGGVLPLAATVVNRDWCDPWRSSDRSRMLFHGHSFTANPLACATGREGLRLFATGDPLDGARRIEERFAQLARSIWPDRIENLRHQGTILAFDLSPGAPGSEDGDRGYLSNRREAVIRAARAEGVLLRPLGDVVYAMPPLCTSDAGLDLIERALRRIAETC